jgi:hypothetical protein
MSEYCVLASSFAYELGGAAAVDKREAEFGDDVLAVEAATGESECWMDATPPDRVLLK